MNQALTDQSVQPELLLSATLYLLSQAALNTSCMGRACMVIEHLKRLESHADTAPAVRAMAYQLCTHWLALYEDLAKQHAQTAAPAASTPMRSGALH